MAKRQSSDACRKSIYGRYKVLLKAFQKPAEAPISVLKACDSQSMLAALSFPEKDITPLARGSMYKYADLVLADYTVPDGYKSTGKNGHYYLDWLRKEVKITATKEIYNRSKAAREQRAKQRIEAAKEEQSHLRANSIRVSKAYIQLLTSIKGMRNDESLDLMVRQLLTNMVHDHIHLYADLFNEVDTIRPGNVEPL